MAKSNAENSGVLWLLLSALVIVVDQIVKTVVISNLQPYDPHAVIPGFLNWTLAFNTGAAFSFLDDHPLLSRWVFSGLAIGASAVFCRWLWRTPRREWQTALPLALVIGGALGNLIDRVRSGSVTDFIQVYYRDWFFPSFNIADSAISVGAVLLLWFGLVATRKGEAR